VTPEPPGRADDVGALGTGGSPTGGESRWSRIVRWHDALFVAKWRSALQREARRQEDALVAVLYLSAFGIDDPAGYHTLPVTAELVDRFHRWHQEQGYDRFPDPGVCC
jgi:hypothetical protein